MLHGVTVVSRHEAVLPDMEATWHLKLPRLEESQFSFFAEHEARKRGLRMIYRVKEGLFAHDVRVSVSGEPDALTLFTTFVEASITRFTTEPTRFKTM